MMHLTLLDRLRVALDFEAPDLVTIDGVAIVFSDLSQRGGSSASK
jgi:hypothetical protein